MLTATEAALRLFPTDLPARSTCGQALYALQEQKDWCHQVLQRTQPPEWQLNRLCRAERAARANRIKREQEAAEARAAVDAAMKALDSANERLIEAGRQLALRRRALRAARDTWMREIGESEPSQYQLSDGYGSAQSPAAMDEESDAGPLSDGDLAAALANSVAAAPLATAIPVPRGEELPSAPMARAGPITLDDSDGSDNVSEFSDEPLKTPPGAGQVDRLRRCFELAGARPGPPGGAASAKAAPDAARPLGPLGVAPQQATLYAAPAARPPAAAAPRPPLPAPLTAPAAPAAADGRSGAPAADASAGPFPFRRKNLWARPHAAAGPYCRQEEI